MKYRLTRWTRLLSALLFAAGISSSLAQEGEIDISKVDPADAVLAEVKQKAIWDAEHYTHLLEWRFGPKFREAFVSGDPAQLAGFFREGFTGGIARLPETPTKQASLMRKWVASTDEKDVETVGAKAFVDWILERKQSVGELKGSQFRILKIEKGEKDTWKLLVLLGARGTASDGSMLSFYSTHYVVASWSGDGEIDGGSIFLSWRPKSASMTAAPAPLMREVTADVGLDRLPIKDNWKIRKGLPEKISFQFAVDDFDRDGYPDIAVGTADRRLMLLRSEKGKSFVEVTTEVGLPPNHYGFKPNYLTAWIDYNNDGFPDLVFGEELYKNEGGKGFVDVTEASGLTFETVPMGAAVADYDGDGLLDLYVNYSQSNKKVPKTERPPGWIGDLNSGAENVLWRNTGKGGFVRVPMASNASGGRAHTFASVWFFADDDHLPDLYNANDFGLNVLLRNRGDGTFEDIAKATNTGDYATSMGVVAGDVDNDGRADLYVANMFSKAGRRVITQVTADDYPPGIYEQIKGACAGNRLYRAAGESMEFSDSAEPLGINKVGWAYGPAMIDYDNDGWLDLYSTCGFLSFDRRKPDG